uniref:Terpene synthase n=1 Tax=Clitopilus sp. TaxID=1967123 RepID=A0A4P2VK29_9AGAR|nr:putative sesquiterpene synthase [Clitopilus sp.]
MSQKSPSTFRIPDLEAIFSAFPDEGTSPYYDDVLPEARAWIKLYQDQVYGPKMTEFIDRCKIELITYYVHPVASRSCVRAMMDLHNLFWLYDEATDVQSGQTAQETAKVVRNSLTSPEFNDGSWLCEMLQDFRKRHLDGVRSSSFVARFIEHFCFYTDRVADEAIYREKQRVLDIPSYMAFRRETAAVRVVMDTVEYCAELELPRTVLDDPVFQVAYDAALDLAFGTNDIHSYNMEQSKDHSGANVITVIMKERGLDVQGAMDYFGGYCEALTAQFLDAKRKIEKREGQEWKDAVLILDGYTHFLTGQVRWGFATERYFGKKNKEVQETRVVELRAPFVDHVDLAD